MIFHINTEFADELLTDFISAIHENNINFTDEPLTIYLNSEGGSVDTMLAILHIINEKPAGFKMIGYGCLRSAAFRLFFYVNVKKSF